MGYREINPSQDFDLYEPKSPSTVNVKKFSFDKINISTPELWNYCIWIGSGLLLIWAGATNAGSYFMPGTRLGEPMSTFFYTWQLGTVMIVSGCLLIYHRFTRR